MFFALEMNPPAPPHNHIHENNEGCRPKGEGGGEVKGSVKGDERG